MAKDLYLDCFSGISGDMFVGALIDLGVPLEVIEHAVSKLKLPEHVHLKAEKQERNGVTGTKFDVHFHVHHSHHHHGHGDHHHHGRHYSDIKTLIERSDLEPFIKDHALSIFKRIGEVEAAIHGKSLEEIHFHEVGAIDSIVDIVGACAALHHLDIQSVHASPLTEGSGTFECAHGTFPIPAPATLGILKKTGAPLRQIELPFELITPTGAAILAEFAVSFAPMNHFQIEEIGWGLGTRHLPNRPNGLRALLGIQSSANPGSLESDSVCVLESNLDDCTGEALGHLCELLLEAGALDVAYSPVTMKKSRPGWQLQVLCAPNSKESIARLIFVNSSTIGLRVSEVSRLKLPREIIQVTTEFGSIHVKIARLDGSTVRVSPEYNDCRAAAAQHGVPLDTVYQAARQAFHS